MIVLILRVLENFLCLSTLVAFIPFFCFLVTHGYLGCADDLVPCSNKTHCVKIEQVCTANHDCVDEHGESVCSYSYFFNAQIFDS